MIRFLSLLLLFCFFPAAAQPLETIFLMGKTTGSMPSLEYGLDYDRLAAAKITFLDTNIIMKVVDSTVNNYKAQLSEEHFFLFAKIKSLKDTTIKTQPNYLTVSVPATGDDKNDFVNIALDYRKNYNWN